MVPSTIDDATPSAAEKRVFTQLASTELAGTALHSLNLPEHEHKLTAEIDFVLVLDDIVLAIEVKGGRVAQRGGVWTYTDRHDVQHQSMEGPFKQVTGAMHGLRSRLKEALPLADWESILFGTLVITPDIDLPASVEWADEAYVGRGPLARERGLEKALLRAHTYWRSKRPGRTMTKDVRTRIVSVLRPDFDVVPNLASRATTLDIAYARLSEEQMSRLDIVLDTPRVMCAGGAGTGKTFLAIEAARRSGLKGERTALITRSGVLAALLRSRLHGQPVHVTAMDVLDPSKQFDTLVVDEGQDLATEASVLALDGAVKGGLDDGRWIYFHDPNRQAHLYDDHEPAALAYIAERAGARVSLQRNCRNTRDIAFHTRAITGADLGVATAGRGPIPDIVPVKDEADEAARLGAWLRLLRDDDVPASEVALVSVTGDWSRSSARFLKQARRQQIARLTAQNADQWPSGGLGWASAVDIKGLESRFVAVIDMDDLSSESHLDRLYVAMSRPRAGLWVGLREACAGRWKELIELHSVDALQALEESR